jgi:hypothetical protein
MASISKTYDADKLASAFLELLFSQCPPDLFIYIWQLAGKRSTWFRVANLAAAAEFAASRPENIYVSLSLSPQDFGPDKRCKAEYTAGIVGLWADVDIRHEAHKETALPETMEQALELVNSIGIIPTIRVDSGHGIQAYWLFRDPWDFADDAEREQGQALTKRFEAAVRRNAELHGWKLDATADLARLFRVPGTLNVKPKCQPVIARLIDGEGPRYDRHDLADRIPEQRSSCSFKVQATVRLDDRELALSALDALRVSRADPYKGDGSWLDVGMALHSVDPSASMLAEWERWSRQSSHYEEGVCAAKWKTFSTGGGLTIGSLIHWAENDGWANPNRRAGASSPTETPADGLVSAEGLWNVLLAALDMNPSLLSAVRTKPIGDRPPRV